MVSNVHRIRAEMHDVAWFSSRRSFSSSMFLDSSYASHSHLLNIYVIGAKHFVVKIQQNPTCSNLTLKGFYMIFDILFFIGLVFGSSKVHMFFMIFRFAGKHLSQKRRFLRI